MIRSIFRGATRSERGFVLVSVLVLALLYFAMLELMLVESSQALRGAQRFRGRIVAHALAENAAELAAHRLVFINGNTISAKNEDGEMKGQSRRLPNHRFEIEASGTAYGTVPVSASVEIRGHVCGPLIIIERTVHSQ